MPPDCSAEGMKSTWCWDASPATTPMKYQGSCGLFYIRRPIDDPDSQKNLALMAAVPRPLPGETLRVRYPRLSLAAAMFSDSSWTQLPLVTSNRMSRWAVRLAAYLDHERPDGAACQC